jgi:BarA-like signal transduction histidine kinase
MSSMTSTSTLLLQHASPADDAALTDLSRLDSARPISRPALMAIVDGRLIAAASLTDHRIVADPFAETTQATNLLRIHLAEISNRRRTPPRRRSPRFALRARAAV